MTIFILVVATLLLPTGSIAQVSSADSGAIESPQEDEDIDTNLVPLEPELTVTPPDLISTGDKPDNPGETAGESPSSNSVVPVAQTPGLLESATAPTATAYNIPVVIDPSVESHIHFFNTSIRGRFEQWLVRLGRYRPLVENIFAEFNLPSDLVYLSLVESGFNPYAFSRAKATGPWQFMKGTGKLYGLRIDHYVDERRDPIKSTVAAARYLRDLYDLFGTWPLAMAAYNAGEGKVMRALHKAQAETFSDISKTKLIRRETKQYVPRIMAATVIARNPDQYGFSQEPVAPHQFEEVVVTRPLHFRAIANTTGIPYEELRLLNPELRRDATPPYDAAYHLKVPVGTGAKVMQLLDRVPTYKFPPLAAKAQHGKTDSSRWYRIRVGDTLEKVSKRFRVPLKTLKARNNLSGPIIKPGEFLIIAH
jgi:membrane-bound lytic murein transglycosylase D